MQDCLTARTRKSTCNCWTKWARHILRVPTLQVFFFIPFSCFSSKTAVKEQYILAKQFWTKLLDTTGKFSFWKSGNYHHTFAWQGKSEKKLIILIHVIIVYSYPLSYKIYSGIWYMYMIMVRILPGTAISIRIWVAKSYVTWHECSETSLKRPLPSLLWQTTCPWRTTSFSVLHFELSWETIFYGQWDGLSRQVLL